MTGIDRRTVLRGAALGASALAAGVLTACTLDAGVGSSPAPRPDTSPTPEPEEATMRALIVYFSRPGENYWHGDRRDLHVGNTQVVAEMIAERTDADVLRLEEADPYPQDYDETVERNRQEQRDDARPAIADALPDLSDYDTIFLGGPVWNTRTPMIIRTFLDQTGALAGKTVHPFLTYAVGEGSVFDDYQELCPDAVVEEGLAIQGEEAADARVDVEEWLDRIGAERG